MTRTVDFTLAYHGSISLLTPITREARAWIQENLETADLMYFGGRSFAVEHRYVNALIAGIMADGLHVSLRR